jgi:hypothetical protein
MLPALVDSATLQAHVDTCTVCESVYANPGELIFEPETQAVLETLKVHLETTADLETLGRDQSSRLQTIKALTLSIQLTIEDLPDSPFRISARLPLLMQESANGLAEFSLHSPAFLSRADGQILVEEMTDASNRAGADGLSAVDNAGYIMDIVDRITTLASTLWQEAEYAREAQLQKKVQDEDDGGLQRVWFWFPSLSTREKRKDLVNYAARWGLTGFVLAGMHHLMAFRSSTDTISLPTGKPGLLCLEGTARQAEDYMSAIKSESWGDIPSYQKKGMFATTDPPSND